MAADDRGEQEEEMLKTAILHLEHDKLKTFYSIEGLKKEITFLRHPVRSQ